MRLSNTLLGALAAAVLALGMSAPALAQGSELPPASQITDDDLQSFAAAATQVQSLMDEWQPLIESAETPEEAATVGQQAQAELVMAVENEGLTVETYNHIAQLAQVDPEIQSKVQEYMMDQ